MKHYFNYLAAVAMLLCLFSCQKDPDDNLYYKMTETNHKNTSVVLWNPDDYDFEAGNSYYKAHFYDMLSESGAAGGCSSWRSGQFHGRNLDWFQGDYGCLIIKMPKSSKVKHSSVAVLNASSSVTKQFIIDGVIDANNKRVLPCAVVDGINDAGVAVNINIVPHVPGAAYIGQEGDLSSQCVVRYLLDNAGSVEEAVKLLSARRISQDVVLLAGDETHYMISDKTCTAVVEFDKGKMVVTLFNKSGNGFYSENGNPAIMTNLYDFAVEKWGLGSDNFFENHPLSMGVERWSLIKSQYDKAHTSVENNIDIAKSVWYFKNFMTDKMPWYSENAIATAYGKDKDGWYYIDNTTEEGEKISCSNHTEAQMGFWNSFMETYWSTYANTYGKMEDPHIKGNGYWETSHTVVYDLDAKKGYLIPYENFYAKDKGKIEPIEISLP